MLMTPLMFFYFVKFLIMFCLLYTEVVFSESVKSRLKTDTEINLYCSKVEPQNPSCLRWAEIVQRRLELESILFNDIKNFCKDNPQNPYCRKTGKISIFTFCAQLVPENNNCLIWQSIKQAELEVKGRLSEEIRNFCQRNQNHILCKGKTSPSKN